MKTPEEMAEEWYWANLTEQAPVVMLSNPVKHPPCPRKAFLAGYEAAKEQLSELRQDIRILNNQLSFFENKVRQMEADRERSK